MNRKGLPMKALTLRVRRSATAAALALALAQAAWASEPNLLSNSPGTYYMGAHPGVIHSLQDLPPDIARSVVSHLKKRLGSNFYAMVSFKGGTSRDPSSTGGCTYQLEFAFSRPSAGIGEFVGVLALNGDGSLFSEIGMPNFGGSARSQRIVPLSTARAIASSAGFQGSDVSVSLDYEPARDCLCWKFTRPAPPADLNRKGVDPSASGKLHFVVLQVLMEETPVVETHDEFAIP